MNSHKTNRTQNTKSTQTSVNTIVLYLIIRLSISEDGAARNRLPIRCIGVFAHRWLAATDLYSGPFPAKAVLTLPDLPVNRCDVSPAPTPCGLTACWTLNRVTHLLQFFFFFDALGCREWFGSRSLFIPAKHVIDSWKGRNYEATEKASVFTPRFRWIWSICVQLLLLYYEHN